MHTFFPNNRLGLTLSWAPFIAKLGSNSPPLAEGSFIYVYGTVLAGNNTRRVENLLKPTQSGDKLYP